MNRREFLRAAGVVGGASLLGRRDLFRVGNPTRVSASRAAALPPLVPPDSVLNSPATECPVDTVVVLMMENRSFDHYFGFLATDEHYLDEGRRLHGNDFAINGRTDVVYTDEFGEKHQTRHVRDLGNEPNLSRGCLHKDPGHGWGPSHIQRDKGFLASGAGTDTFAISYYTGDLIPVQANLARRFTVMDSYHSAVLGPTWINRPYLYAATSEGRTRPPKPLDTGVYKAPTIIDRLASAGVSTVEYFINISPALLWGNRMLPHVRSTDQYFLDVSRGQLPQVSFLTPGMGVPFRTDDHPQGDIGIGQRFIHAVFSAFVRSPQWQRGMFVLTYDEHGGFYDHVKPPVVEDDHVTGRDRTNLGQLGFRVPTVLASPYAPRNYVDHNLYDHTSIMRFLEWRFLGAPPQGPGKSGDQWFLTKRDRHTNNFGASLRSGDPDPEVDLDAPLAAIPQATVDCDHARRLSETGMDDSQSTFQVSDELERLAKSVDLDGVTFTPWVEQTGVRDLPAMADDRPR
jgi:phospholipase C